MGSHQSTPTLTLTLAPLPLYPPSTPVHPLENHLPTGEGWEKGGKFSTPIPPLFHPTARCKFNPRLYVHPSLPFSHPLGGFGVGLGWAYSRRV